MPAAAALSRGPDASVHGFRGQVLAVFPSAVYVAPATGDLLVVHDAAHGHTPTSVLVEHTALGSWPIATGDAVVGRAGWLKLGPLVLDVRHVPVWSPPPPAAPAATPPPTAMLRELERLAAQPHGRAVADGVHALVLALVAGRSPVPALHRMVGRGPGLTPAGDDALVGVLAALHRATPPEAAAPLLAALAQHLPPRLDRTTPISAHYLRLALRGAFTERLLCLVDAAAARRPLGHHLSAVLATGATSGADAITGMLTALSLLAGHGDTHPAEEVA